MGLVYVIMVKFLVLHLLTYLFKYYLFCCLSESYFDVLASFCWCLKEECKVFVLHEYFCLLYWNFSPDFNYILTIFIYLSVHLSTQKLLQDYNSILPLHTKTIIIQMMLNLISKIIPRNIVYKKNSRTAPVKSFYYRSETLLTCCVPYLHFYWCFFVYVYDFRVKLYTKCSSISLPVGILCKSI